MGQKIRPDSFRLGINKPWLSRWFFKNRPAKLLAQDETIRTVINQQMNKGGITNIEIERTVGRTKIIIHAARPGLIIGRGGENIAALEKSLNKALVKLDPSAADKKFPLNINIEEIKRGDVSASLIAQQIAWDIAKRFRYRRTIKKYLEQAAENRNVKGVKIKISGRLDGAEIARSERLVRGKIPLQTIRSDIDYGQTTAFTNTGTIGIKVWLYKGDIFK